MSEINVELRMVEACRAALARMGIEYRPATMILFAMVDRGVAYGTALEHWAGYKVMASGRKWPPERWHSEICYHLVKARIIEPPAQWFEMMVGEVLQHAH